jgi:hypothetical protein
MKAVLVVESTEKHAHIRDEILTNCNDQREQCQLLIVEGRHMLASGQRHLRPAGNQRE